MVIKMVVRDVRYGRVVEMFLHNVWYYVYCEDLLEKASLGEQKKIYEMQSMLSWLRSENSNYCKRSNEQLRFMKQCVADGFSRYLKGVEDEHFLRDTTEISILTRIQDANEGKLAWYLLEHSNVIVNQ